MVSAGCCCVNDLELHIPPGFPPRPCTQPRQSCWQIPASLRRIVSRWDISCYVGGAKGGRIANFFLQKVMQFFPAVFDP